MIGKPKKHHPYINLTVFSLAAAGVATLVHKAKKFIKEKTCEIKKTMKSD